MNLIIATGNPGKAGEIREILKMPGLIMLGPEDFVGWPEVEETGKTFEENARLKAEALRSFTGMNSLAEDSGLMVDCLGGRPGVFSSRYAGPEGDASRNIERLLSELKGVPAEKRTARFHCAVALSLADGRLYLAEGDCQGTILTERRGSGGFGYDPVFAPRGLNRSMAELSPEEKNEVSHRGEALRAIREIIALLVAEGIP